MNAAQRRSQQLREFFTELSKQEILWLKDASHIYGIRERRLRRLCEEKNIGVKLAGDWVIIVDKLEKALNLQPAASGVAKR
jgi:hypothetical protein